jgi:hypothetical protein
MSELSFAAYSGLRLRWFGADRKSVFGHLADLGGISFAGYDENKIKQKAQMKQ